MDEIMRGFVSHDGGDRWCVGAWAGLEAGNGALVHQLVTDHVGGGEAGVRIVLRRAAGRRPSHRVEEPHRRVGPEAGAAMTGRPGFRQGIQHPAGELRRREHLVVGEIRDARQHIRIAAAQGEVCTVANDNDPGQVVLSGHKAAIERAIAMVKDFEIKRGVGHCLGAA